MQRLKHVWFYKSIPSPDIEVAKIFIYNKIEKIIYENREFFDENSVWVKSWINVINDLSSNILNRTEVLKLYQELHDEIIFYVENTGFFKFESKIPHFYNDNSSSGFAGELNIKLFSLDETKEFINNNNCVFFYELNDKIIDFWRKNPCGMISFS
jgi:hypothetical protein